MDCNCSQNGRPYGQGMSGRPMSSNARNMYYGRNPMNGRGVGGQNMNHRGNNCGCGMNGHVSGIQNDKKYDGCNIGNEPVDKMEIGMCYVPWQKWQNIFNMDEGLQNGTIFADLCKPYLGRPVK